MFVTCESCVSLTLILVRGNPRFTVIWMLCQQYLCIWNLTKLQQRGGSSLSEKLEVNQLNSDVPRTTFVQECMEYFNWMFDFSFASKLKVCLGFVYL